MAIKKKMDLNRGIIAEYHRIDNVNFGISGNGNITVYSYTSEQWRQMEKDALAAKEEPTDDAQIISINQYSVHAQEYPFTLDIENDNVNFPYLYGKLKEMETFKDAEDC
jgi:hypothetical protein